MITLALYNTSSEVPVKCVRANDFSIKINNSSDAFYQIRIEFPWLDSVEFTPQASVSDVINNIITAQPNEVIHIICDFIK